MLASHALLYFMWLAWRFHGGAVPHPNGLTDTPAWFARMAGLVVEHAAPTWEAVAIYGGFLLAQLLAYAWLPGLEVKGLPVPAEGGRQLSYRINGIWAWYLTLITVLVLHVTGVFPLPRIGELLGPLMTSAMLVANATAVVLYLGAKLAGRRRRFPHRSSGSPLYDFFMGVWLNPRIGVVDLKMWAEIRVSWILLFLLTLGAAATQHAEHGHLSTPMIFMLVAHGLYTNACMKGEECIPTTWDIFREKWGWMLVFWNLAGVPFLYTFNSWYLASRPPFEHSLPYTIMCFALLLGAYYVWDTAQSQRNRFRMMERGTYVERRAFPQLPWGTLRSPRTLETRSGSKLLVDGWWRYARKIHYTADVAMALSWGLICGFDHFLPYLYFSFFVVMIGHRARRDIERCRRKYGEDWDRYVREVPWLFVPGVV